MKNILSELEISYDTVNLFKYKNSTSWVNVKNYLFVKSLAGNVNCVSKEGYVSKDGIYLFLLSIIHYVKIVFYKPAAKLYFGAGSGLFSYKGSTLDSYLPYNETEGKPSFYFISAERPSKLIQHVAYLKKNNVVIVSFLLAPFKYVFTKILARFVQLDIPMEFLEELTKHGIVVSAKELSAIHARFIVSYYLYRMFLFPLRISKAYVVSAYSNTELISVLQKYDVEVNELQHGVIGVTHRAYNYKCNSSILPTPDNVFVYDEFWKSELLNAGYYKEEQVRITGRLKYSLVDFELAIPEEPFIVFTGQGGFYKEILTFFREAESVLSRTNIRLLYIPHPNECGKALDDFCFEVSKLTFVYTLIETEFTTEQYIYNSLAHISVYSSCHFDAIYYKNRTYVLNVMKDNPMHYYTLEYPNLFIYLEDLEEVSILQGEVEIVSLD